MLNELLNDFDNAYYRANLGRTFYPPFGYAFDKRALMSQENAECRFQHDYPRIVFLKRVGSAIVLCKNQKPSRVWVRLQRTPGIFISLLFTCVSYFARGSSIVVFVGWCRIDF